MLTDYLNNISINIYDNNIYVFSSSNNEDECDIIYYRIPSFDNIKLNRINNKYKLDNESKLIFTFPKSHIPTFTGSIHIAPLRNNYTTPSKRFNSRLGEKSKKKEKVLGSRFYI